MFRLFTTFTMQGLSLPNTYREPLIREVKRPERRERPSDQPNAGYAYPVMNSEALEEVAKIDAIHDLLEVGIIPREEQKCEDDRESNWQDVPDDASDSNLPLEGKTDDIEFLKSFKIKPASAPFSLSNARGHAEGLFNLYSDGKNSYLAINSKLYPNSCVHWAFFLLDLVMFAVKTGNTSSLLELVLASDDPLSQKKSLIDARSTHWVSMVSPYVEGFKDNFIRAMADQTANAAMIANLENIRGAKLQDYQPDLDASNRNYAIYVRDQHAYVPIVGRIESGLFDLLFDAHGEPIRFTRFTFKYTRKTMTVDRPEKVEDEAAANQAYQDYRVATEAKNRSKKKNEKKEPLISKKEFLVGKAFHQNKTKRDEHEFLSGFDAIGIEHVLQVMDEYPATVFMRPTYGKYHGALVLISKTVIFPVKDATHECLLEILSDDGYCYISPELKFTPIEKRSFGAEEVVKVTQVPHALITSTTAKVVEKIEVDVGSLIRNVRRLGAIEAEKKLNTDPQATILISSRTTNGFINFQYPLHWHLAIKNPAAVIRGSEGQKDRTDYDLLWKERYITKAMIEAACPGIQLKDYTKEEYCDSWEVVVLSQLKVLAGVRSELSKIQGPELDQLQELFDRQMDSLNTQLRIIKVEKNKLKPFSKRHRHYAIGTEVRGNGLSHIVSDVNLSFKYGPAGLAVLSKLREFQEPLKQFKASPEYLDVNYCHPFLRSASDYLRTRAWVNVLNSTESTVLDIGSKYHRLIPSMVNEARTPKKWLLLRPNLWASDIVYNEKHFDTVAALEPQPSHFYFNGGLVNKYVDPKNPDQIFYLDTTERAVLSAHSRFRGEVLAVDSFYYRDVQEFIKGRLADGTVKKAHVVAFTCPTQEGNWGIFDGEGSVTVVKQVDTVTKAGFYEMRFRPRGNGEEYRNEVLSWDVQNPRDMYEPYRNGSIFYRLVESIPLGPHVRMFYYELTYHGVDATFIPKLDNRMVGSLQLYDDELAKYCYACISSRLTSGSDFFGMKYDSAIGLLLSYMNAMLSTNAITDFDLARQIATAHQCYSMAKEMHVVDSSVAPQIQGVNDFFPNNKDFRSGKKVRFIDDNTVVVPDHHRLSLYQRFKNGVSVRWSSTTRHVRRFAEELDIVDGHTYTRHVQTKFTPNIRNPHLYVPRGNLSGLVDDKLPEEDYITLNDAQEQLLPQNVTDFKEAGLEACGFNEDVSSSDSDYGFDHLDEGKQMLGGKVRRRTGHVGYTDFATCGNGLGRKYFVAKVKDGKRDVDGLIDAYSGLREALKNAEVKDRNINVVEAHRIRRERMRNTGVHFPTAKRINPKIFPVTTRNTTFAALCRQMGHLHRPDKYVVAKFRDFVDNELRRRLRKTQWRPRVISFEEFLKDVEPSKKAAYLKGYEAFMESGKIKNTMTFFQKANELHYDVRSAKPRAIANPTDVAKAIGAWINKCYLTNIREIFPEICVGYNSHEVAQKLEECFYSVFDHQTVTWDGSQHDSHQFASLLRCVDNSFFLRTLRELLVSLGIPSCYHYSVFKSLLNTSTNFKICHKMGSGRARIVRTIWGGRIRGTVFSGHATRTTLGNSLRVIMYVAFIMHLAGIAEMATDLPGYAYKFLVSGDDVVLIIRKALLGLFKKHFDRVYINGNAPGFTVKTKVTHGLGQVSKDYCDVGQHSDFLSKNIIVYRKQVLFNRKVTRAVQSGHFTERLFSGYTKANHNQNITDQLASWGYTWPGVSGYIQWRIKNVPMMPMSRKQLDKYAKQKNFYRERYKAILHSNSHVLDEAQRDQVRLALGNTTFLMDADPSSIPDLLPKLSNK